MRKLIIIAALGLFAGATVLSTQTAQAGNDEATETDEALDLTMEETGSASLDAVFKKSESPVETLDSVRADIRGVNLNLVSTMGLKEGTPFKDALAELKTKSEGKVNVAFEDKKVPTFKAEEGVPADVTKAVDGLNASFAKLGDAEDKVTKAGQELVGVSTEAADLISKPKDLGLKAMQIPKAVSKGNNNVKKLKGAVDVTTSLVTEMGTLMTDVKGAF